MRHAGYLNGLGDIPVDTIPAGVFGRIQRIIRRFYKSLEVISVLAQPDADRNVLEFGLFDGRADALRNGHRPIHGGRDEQAGKFIPTGIFNSWEAVPINFMVISSIFLNSRLTISSSLRMA
jgi:hypothetical protein